jgi:RNA polymerase sigma factor (TIGR02999 family)
MRLPRRATLRVSSSQRVPVTEPRSIAFFRSSTTTCAASHAGSSHAVQPTTLVHEAYLKLAGSAPRAENRVHLLAIAAHAMRQVLVDHARERRAAKRGPEWLRTTLTDGVSTTNLDADALLALDDALERLDPRQRQVVECRFFAGLDDAEIADALGVTTRTVRRDWVKARAWLYRTLYETPAD